MHNFDDIISILEEGECIPDTLILFQDTPSTSISEIEILSCPICTGIFNTAVTDNCDPPHTFGKTCIEKCLEKKQECPISRSPLQKRDLRKIPISLSFYINRLACCCAFNFLGCKWSGELGEMKNHTKKTCNYSFPIRSNLTTNFFSDLIKMNPKKLNQLCIKQKDLDQTCFPLRDVMEIPLLSSFAFLTNLSLIFEYHTFNNSKEWGMFGKTLGELSQLKNLNLQMNNPYAFCYNQEVDLTYWFHIEKKEMNVSRVINWKGINDTEFECIFKNIENCQEIEVLNLDFSYNNISANCILKILQKLGNLFLLQEIALNFSNQKQLNVNFKDQLQNKKISNCFNSIDLEKNLNFLFFMGKKTLKTESQTIFEEKLKNFII